MHTWMPPQQQYQHAAALPPSTWLHDAAEAGDALAVSDLLRHGWSANARAKRPNYEEGATALHMAAQTGNLEVALALLRAGARPDGAGPRELKHQPEVGHHGKWDGDLSPLHEASARGHAAVVGALLSAGEHADRVAMGGKLGLVGQPEQAFFGERDGGHAPLHLASAFGHAGVVRALVEAGASVQGGGARCDDSPLHYAARAGHVETMAVLIDAGANVNACDEIGNTPLHAVADVRSLELLLASGANPNKAAESSYGVSTPLATYCTLVHRLEESEEGMEKATAIVEALLRGGAETETVPATCDFPRVPILSCAAKNGVPGIVKALLASGLDPDGRDKVGWAPLHDAAQGDHVEALRLLLRAGADADGRTLRGKWTPLHVACRYTSVGCVLELLRWGADLNSKTGVDSDHDAWRSAPILGATRIGVSEGCGKTPAEVVGLKNRAAAPAAPASKGGSADPSQDEDGQMEVLDADTGEPDTSAAARNAIRAALHREASWRRRRALVLLRVRLDAQLDAGAGVAPTAPATPAAPAATGRPSGVRVRRRGGEFEGGAKARRTEDSPSWSEVRGGWGRKDVVRLRGLLGGVVDLGGHEEALFRQVVMFL